MKILVIGSGGREHALVWCLGLSKRVEKIFCVPGNAGIANVAECVSLDISDFKSIMNFVNSKNIDITVVGPEIPLSEGIVDFFQSHNLKIFGPNKLAAKLESSKIFSKNIMQKYNIPTALYRTFNESHSALKFIDTLSFKQPIVVKADGLAAGKGVIICNKKEEAKKAINQMMEEKVFGKAGGNIILEDFLEGEEVSVQIFTDGNSYQIMPSAQDHKRVNENDEGPNTGGMGAFAPVPLFNKDLSRKVELEIIKPLLEGLKKENIVYRGVLYIGLMIFDGKPYVLEFNARFGDPETQVVLPLLKTDLTEIIESINDGKLDKIKVEWYNKTAVCVVLASGGYPGKYENGKNITGFDEAQALKNVMLFHAGTKLDNSNSVVTAGGRVMGVTGIGKDTQEAINVAYEGVSKIYFEGMHYRRDIGRKCL